MIEFIEPFYELFSALGFLRQSKELEARIKELKHQLESPTENSCTVETKVEEKSAKPSTIFRNTESKTSRDSNFSVLSNETKTVGNEDMIVHLKQQALELNSAGKYQEGMIFFSFSFFFLHFLMN